MEKRNSVVLFLIAVFSLILSGVLVWWGVNILEESPGVSIFNPQVRPTPEINILGQEKESTFSADKNIKIRVLRVIDGDTIEIEENGKKYKLRYLGIDTPETVDPRRGVQCFGKEASNENKSLVEGKEITLEKDISEIDRFGRLLRYVYLKLDDGKVLFVNDYLVREGFAKALTYPPDVKYNERFLEAERGARENKKGLWGKC